MDTCPHCGSHNVTLVRHLADDPTDPAYAAWTCHDCGMHAPASDTQCPARMGPTIGGGEQHCVRRVGHEGPHTTVWNGAEKDR